VKVIYSPTARVRTPGFDLEGSDLKYGRLRVKKLQELHLNMSAENHVSTGG